MPEQNVGGKFPRSLLISPQSQLKLTNQNGGKETENLAVIVIVAYLSLFAKTLIAKQKSIGKYNEKKTVNQSTNISSSVENENDKQSVAITSGSFLAHGICIQRTAAKTIDKINSHRSSISSRFPLLVEIFKNMKNHRASRGTCATIKKCLAIFRMSIGICRIRHSINARHSRRSTSRDFFSLDEKVNFPRIDSTKLCNRLRWWPNVSLNKINVHILWMENLPRREKLPTDDKRRRQKMKNKTNANRKKKMANKIFIFAQKVFHSKRNLFLAFHVRLADTTFWIQTNSEIRFFVRCMEAKKKKKFDSEFRMKATAEQRWLPENRLTGNQRKVLGESSLDWTMLRPEANEQNFVRAHIITARTGASNVSVTWTHFFLF